MGKWETREANRLKASHFLKVAKVDFTEHNNGAHLKVLGVIDFWPGTGLWKHNSISDRGVESLIEYAKTFSKKNSLVITNGQNQCPCCGAELVITLTKAEKQ